MIDAELKRTVDEAAHWLARVHAHDCNEQEREALRHWQLANPRHREVFERMSQQVGSLRSQPLLNQPQQQLIHLLNVPSSRRRLLRGGTLGLLLLGVSQFDPNLRPSLWDSSLSTGTGERKTFTLADGSELTLNACSRVVPDFNAQQRRLSMRQGELLIRCMADPRGPLQVDSRDAMVLSQDASFVLNENEQGTRVDVLRSSVIVRSATAAPVTVKAGQSAFVQGLSPVSVGPTRGNRLAWLKGQLDVDNESLGAVIDAIRSYRRGIIRISPAAAKLRVSGVFKLDDSEQSLSLLALSLPIEVRRYSDYWINVEVKHAA